MDFGGELHGVDVSAVSIPFAEATDAYESAAVADLQEPLACGDASFDALVCVGVMRYLPDVEATWREFARAVRPSDLVVATQRRDLWSEQRCQAVIDRLACRRRHLGSDRGHRAETLSAGQRRLRRSHSGCTTSSAGCMRDPPPGRRRTESALPSGKSMENAHTSI